MIENKTLAEDKKRRMYQRYNCNALAKWSYFSKNKFFDAKITNFSRNGIYFETHHEISPRTTIVTRVETLLSKDMRLDDHVSLRFVSLLEVKWCTELSKDDIRCFGVGARHLDL